MQGGYPEAVSVELSSSVLGNLDSPERPVGGVGGLDLAEGHTEDEEHRVLLNDASATSRNAALALNAKPRPAAASMSISLAPLPTATVCSIGTPACCAKALSAFAFRSVDDGTGHTLGG
jgi:hypothetical protein